MPDYAACLNRACDRRHSCARYLMRRGDHQTVGEFEAEGCDHFWRTSEAPFRLMWPIEADVSVDRLSTPEDSAP